MTAPWSRAFAVFGVAVARSARQRLEDQGVEPNVGGMVMSGADGSIVPEGPQMLRQTDMWALIAAVGELALWGMLAVRRRPGATTPDVVSSCAANENGP